MPGFVVRCPRCGADAPDDAAWCPRCGKALAEDVLLIERDDDGAPPAVETTRDRRPIVIAVVVVAVLLGGLMLTSGGGDAEEDDDGDEAAAADESSTTSTTRRSRPRIFRRPTSSTTPTLPPPFAPRPVEARIVLARDGGLFNVDIDGNTVVDRNVPELGLAFPGIQGRSSISRRGEWLAFQGDEGTYAIPLEGDEPARLLAPSVLFVPALDEREVWVVEPPSGTVAHVRRWRVDGPSVSPAYALPPDWTPVTAVDGGIVLRRGDRFQIWEPTSGRTVYASEPGVTLLAAGGHQVAWQVYCDVPLCSLHITDTRTGADRSLFLGNLGVDYGVASFSPDGSHLLAWGHRSESANQWITGLLSIDVVEGGVRFLDMSNQPTGGIIAWAPGGRSAVLLPGEGSPISEPTVFVVGHDEVIDLDLPSGVRGVDVVAY